MYESLPTLDKGTHQGDLFTQAVSGGGPKREALLATLERAQSRWGANAIGVGSVGIKADRRWEMRRDNVTPAYTTRWEDLARVT